MTLRSKPLECINTAVKLTVPKSKHDHEEMVSYIGYYLGHNYKQIAHYFDLTNHSTIIHKIKKAKSNAVKKPLYKRKLKEAKRLLGLDSKL